MDKVIFKRESYNIIGCCFDVFNKLGPGLREKNYQKALDEVFSEKKIEFKSQLYVPIKINNKVIGKYFLDFIVSNQIAVELKVGNNFHRRDIEQLFSYLKSSNLKLGILVNFTYDEVRYRRILNIKNYS